MFEVTAEERIAGSPGFPYTLVAMPPRGYQVERLNLWPSTLLATSFRIQRRTTYDSSSRTLILCTTDLECDHVCISAENTIDPSSSHQRHSKLQRVLPVDSRPKSHERYPEESRRQFALCLMLLFSMLCCG